MLSFLKLTTKLRSSAVIPSGGFPRKLWWLLLPLIATVSFVVKSQSTLPVPVNLSTTPLYSSGTRDKPTLSLALSVEFPTVGAQYLDATYAPTTEYLGYFDTESCYTYNNHANEDLRRFDRLGAATARGCGGTGFSGNFMNWASSSAIDVLRLGLTGGDRIVDTESLTVLQRAVLRTGFWNSSNFPSKELPAAAAANAVPNNLRQGYTGTIYVANCLNRIHFGSAATGDCGTPGNNSNLGTSLPSGIWNDFIECAGENGTCVVPTSAFPNSANNTNIDFVIAYGVDSRFTFNTKTFKKGDNDNKRDVLCSNGTLGPDPAPGTVKRCYYRLSSSVNPQFMQGTQYGGPVLTANNFFYSRVRVCEATGDVLNDPRASDLADKQRALCFKYPNGTFKPVGQLQKNSDNLRVAVFGYLMDDRQERYGGVLRAPMKYVGGKTYDATGNLISGTNPRVEWSENTGIFVPNPENATEGKSGAVNYLNQFGRTGPTPGLYKTYDPVGELYYEALRYVQGLDPTSQAIEDLTTERKDGYPVYTTWTDPHAGGSSSQNYSCVRNNILVIGDVNTHNDKSVPGVPSTRSGLPEFSRAANISTNEPDFHAWTQVVGGFEAGQSPGISYFDGKNIARTTSNPNATKNAARQNMQNENIGATNASYYMAGMAYWANTHDIRGTDWTAQPNKQRPGMRVSTYVLDVNENGSMTDTNRRRTANQFFFASKYGGFDDKSEKGNPFLDKNGALDNSNWERQGDAGEAKNYFLSSNARAVLGSLDNIFEAIAKKGNSIAGGAISAKKLTATNYIYQAQFDPAAWNGDLTSISITSGTSLTLGTSPQWSAAAQLDNKTPASRNIVVGKTTPTASNTATPFTWAGIDADLIASLNKANSSTAPDARGEARLNYLRGDRTLETSTTAATLRRRASRLGDIINSGVIFSGEPTSTINTDSYRTFYNTNKSRTKALFVGANDGMLHAFNSATGDELFAYIPSWLGTTLSELSNDSYVTNHKSYVDATPAVAEAEVGTTWKTVLVGGTGAGGQGVYALDVTSPDEFTASKVMWEFTDKNDVSMGNVIGEPQIRKFRISAENATTPVYKWFAVVASGVNNYVSDGRASTTSNPAIFLLDLDKSSGTAWVEGSNYYKILFPVNTSLGTKATGLANFDVTLGLANEVVYLYAGDLHGQMWKLDFSKSAASVANWTVERLSVFSSANGPLPFFVAKDSTGIPQPITSAPLLANGPNNSTLVVFGTGKYLESSDNTVSSSTQVQSVYSIHDNGSGTNDTSPAGVSAINGRGRLQSGSINSAGVVTFATFKYGKPLQDSDVTQRSGWYIDLPKSGERQISTPETIGRTLTFGSVIPPSSVTQVCGTGTGFLYQVDLLTGSGTSVESTLGPLGPPLPVDLSSTYTKSDSTGRRTKTTITQIILQGSVGTGLGGTVSTSTNVGRLSWRQLNNYQELRNAP